MQDSAHVAPQNSITAPPCAMTAPEHHKADASPLNVKATMLQHGRRGFGRSANEYCELPFTSDVDTHNGSEWSNQLLVFLREDAGDGTVRRGSRKKLEADPRLSLYAYFSTYSTAQTLYKATKFGYLKLPVLVSIIIAILYYARVY